MEISSENAVKMQKQTTPDGQEIELPVVDKAKTETITTKAT